MTKRNDQLPKNITFSFVGAAEIDLEVYDLFNLMLKDYCKRFNVKVSKEPWHVGVAFVNLNGYEEPGCTMLVENNTILVQVKDPFLDDQLPGNYPFTNAKYIEIICHEFVHVCQTLTGRKGLDLTVKHNKKDKLEKYYFDPEEMEARLLESFYANLIAYPLLMENTDEKTNIRY